MPKTLYVDNTDIPREKKASALTENVVVGASTIRVQSILGFTSLTTSSGQIAMIGKLGNERTEIVRTSNATAPSQAYKWVYLRDTLKFNHSTDDEVTILDWNRIDIQHSATTSGTKGTIMAYPFAIQADQLESSYVDSTQSAGFYFIRFNESIENTNGDWSDPIPFLGYDDNSVAAIKDRAVEFLDERIDGKVITHQFLEQALWEARRTYHQAPGKRPFRRKFNVDIGDVLTGSARIEAPADVERDFTAENYYGVRIGTSPNMMYQDKKEHDYEYQNTANTTLLDDYTKDTSKDLYVVSARDFAGSGVVSIEGTNINYRDKSNTGGTLRISEHGDWDASAGSDVWQNITLGLPDRFTVWADPEGSAFIYFNRPFSTMYAGQNIYLDYYRTLVGFDSDADILDEPDPDMYTNYLMAKIKHRRDRGNSDITKDSDYKVFKMRMDNALANEYLATKIRIRPGVDHLSYPA